MKLKKHPTTDDLRHLREKQPHLLRYWKTLVPVKQAQLLYLRDKFIIDKIISDDNFKGSGNVMAFELVVSTAYYIETHRDCN